MPAGAATSLASATWARCGALFSGETDLLQAASASSGRTWMSLFIVTSPWQRWVMIYLYSYLHSGYLDKVPAGLHQRWRGQPARQETAERQPRQRGEYRPGGEVDRHAQQRAERRHHRRRGSRNRVAHRVAHRHRLGGDGGIVHVDRRHRDTRLQLAQPAACLVDLLLRGGHAALGLDQLAELAVVGAQHLGQPRDEQLALLQPRGRVDHVLRHVLRFYRAAVGMPAGATDRVLKRVAEAPRDAAVDAQLERTAGRFVVARIALHAEHLAPRRAELVAHGDMRMLRCRDRRARQAEGQAVFVGDARHRDGDRIGGASGWIAAVVSIRRLVGGRRRRIHRNRSKTLRGRRGDVEGDELHLRRLDETVVRDPTREANRDGRDAG